MVSPYVLIYLAAYVVPAIVGFFALILYTHLLSPAEYGVYVIGASIAGIVSAMCFSWICQSVARYQARSPDLDLRAEAIVGYGGTVAVIACLAPIVVLIIRPNIGVGVIAGSLFMSLSFTAFEISQEFKRAQFNPLRFMTVAVIRSVSALAMGYTAITLGGGGLGLLLAVGASFLIANLFSLPRKAAKPLQFDAVYFTQFMRYGLPFTLGAAAIALHSALDRLGVAYLLGQSGAGYYGLTAEITRQLIGILAASVASAMFPIAFRSLAQSGPAVTRARLAEGLELLLAIIAPVTVWLMICAHVVAGTLLGSEFQASVATLLPLLAVGRLCGAINQYYLQISFQIAERPLLQVAHDGLILILNLALLFPLTLWFGLPGTAAAVLIAEAFGVLVGIWLSRRAFRLPLNGWGVARVFAATATMALATYVVKSPSSGHGLLTLFAEFCAGGIAYVGSAILFDVAGVRSMIGLSRPRWVAAE